MAKNRVPKLEMWQPRSGIAGLFELLKVLTCIRGQRWEETDKTEDQTEMGGLEFQQTIQSWLGKSNPQASLEAPRSCIIGEISSTGEPQLGVRLSRLSRINLKSRASRH